MSNFKPNEHARGLDGRFIDMNKDSKLRVPTPTTNSLPVGEQFIDNANTIAEGLFERKQDWDDLPIGGCYRINDFGDYVTEEDWDEVWDGHPLEEKAWMLADNGRYTSDDVAKMSPDGSKPPTMRGTSTPTRTTSIPPMRTIRKSTKKTTMISTNPSAKAWHPTSDGPANN